MLTFVFKFDFKWCFSFALHCNESGFKCSGNFLWLYRTDSVPQIVQFGCMVEKAVQTFAFISL